MRNVCVKNGNAAGFFSFLCNGTIDISAKQQMSSFAKNKAVHEVFVGLEKLHATTGGGIAKKLFEALSFCRLHLKKMRAQGYDGCASMNGTLMVYNSGSQSFLYGGTVLSSLNVHGPLSQKNIYFLLIKVFLQ